MNQTEKLEELVKSQEEEIRKLRTEKKLEEALERVRDRTMAMKTSEELSEVVSVVYKELQRVGIDIHLALILIYDWRAKRMEWWSSGQGVDILPTKFNIQITSEFEKHP